MRDLLRATRALSDESRLRMLKLLLDKEICICEMREIFPKSESQISRHLKILMDAGFLKRWTDGRCVVYAADRETKNNHCRALMEFLGNSLNDDKWLQEDRKKLQKVVEDQVREKCK